MITDELESASFEAERRVLGIQTKLPSADRFQRFSWALARKYRIGS